MNQRDLLKAFIVESFYNSRPRSSSAFGGGRPARTCPRHPGVPMKKTRFGAECPSCTDENFNEIEKDSDGRVISPYGDDYLRRNSVSSSTILLG